MDDSQDISFSDVVPHVPDQYDEDDDHFRNFSLSSTAHMDFGVDEENDQVENEEDKPEPVQLESPSKRSRKYKSEVKKVLSKWLLFSAEQRPQVMKEFPHYKFAEIAAAVAQRYQNMSPEDSERLDAAVALDKERYKAELAEAEDDLPRNNSSTATSQNQLPTSNLEFPLSKVRRACKMDPDVKAINKDALPLITKAVELFVGYLARKAAYTVSLRGVKQIKETDVIQTIHMHDSLEFLRIDFPRKAAPSKPTAAPKLRITAPPSSFASIGSGASSNSGASGVGTKAKAGRPSGASKALAPVVAGKGIDKFFGGGKRAAESAELTEGKRERESEDDAEDVVADDDVVAEATEDIENEDEELQGALLDAEDDVANVVNEDEEA